MQKLSARALWILIIPKGLVDMVIYADLNLLCNLGFLRRLIELAAAAVHKQFDDFFFPEAVKGGIPLSIGEVPLGPRKLSPLW